MTDRKRHAMKPGLSFQTLLFPALMMLLALLPSPGQSEELRATAGSLELVFTKTTEGIQLQALRDLGYDRDLLAENGKALFELIFYDSEDEEIRISSEKGWNQTDWTLAEDELFLQWKGHDTPGLEDFRVEVRATPLAEDSAWQWHLRTEGILAETRLEDVAFPQITLNSAISDGGILYPDGPGALIQHHWLNDTQKWQRYGGGWGSMQFMAAFSKWTAEEHQSGLYFAMHDPKGSEKEIVFQSKAEEKTATFFFEHAIPDTTKTNDYELPGKAVWRLFRGDWFEAAQYYKSWAKNTVLWWPELGDDGREDTPLWMRELSVWAQTGGSAEQVVERVKAFAEFLEVPVGFHWYNWHEIPFDNDYPHYFPAKEGFEDAVRELQEADVYVMPYINGRLWDTHDCEDQDCHFTSVALPAVTKKDDGSPVTEKYGSKEKDGSEVALGVMCPSTQLWQDKVNEIVARLHQNCGTKGVYLDQIAAATPVLCMDKDHGHPLAGGSWWNESYWTMLDRMRAEMPAGHMITTECNGEPFVNRFDGYLSWHWQTDGQLPVFPAIYGGTIQCFGRAFGGGDTKELALRMKTGQQLVFGEQIGWINPDFAMAEDNKDFFKQVVQLRWLLRRYFYAGEMLRPPVLDGTMPRVRADWQWHGEHWVHTDALLSGAWTIPKENKTALIFANVSDEALAMKLVIRRSQDKGDTALNRTVLQDKNTPPLKDTITPGHSLELTLEPQTVCAWEFEEAVVYGPR